MSINKNNSTINSCGYTPVYFIHNPAAHQVEQPRYLIANTNQNIKPVSDSLRRFYESSGNLENSATLNTVQNNTRPVLKVDGNQMGNNLKLANFLLPKKECKPQILSNNKISLSTAVNARPSIKVNALPNRQDERNIVKLKSNPIITKPVNVKLMPKIKPNENVSNSSKHTVQLLKLGGTYHSLNQLNDGEMKIVNQALKNLKDPENVPLQPTYDPVSNTKFIYKIISPKDLAVVGKNKVIIKPKKNGVNNVILKTEPRMVDVQQDLKKTEPLTEMKTTRSGRVIKSPKQLLGELSPQKYRKKSGTIVSCVQCSTDFESLYRLQKHYETHPTHMPSKTHANLFHCLQAIVNSGSEQDRSNIFIQQLQQLLEKLKSLLPCMLKKIDGSEGKLCTISEDIGRVLGMNPGKYNLNMDALECTRNINGHCKHNPPKTIAPQFNSDLSKPSQLWLSKHNEEIAQSGTEYEDCARINSVENLPVPCKRVLKLKQQKSQELNAKRRKITSENNEAVIELGIQSALKLSSVNGQSAINVQTNMVPSTSTAEQIITVNHSLANADNTCNIEGVKTNKINALPQFHSAHFDIRSSPIKPSSTVFRTIQINPQQFSKQKKPEVLQPLKIKNDIPQNVNNAQSTLTDKEKNIIDSLPDIQQLGEVSKSNSFPSPESNETQTNSDPAVDLENILKDFKELQPKATSFISNDVAFQKSDDINKLDQFDSQITSSQNQSVLNFLDSFANECFPETEIKKGAVNLSYPETEIKNFPVDINDFLSFSNS